MADTAVQTARHRVVGLLVGEVVMFDLAIADQVFGRTDGYTWSVCGVRRGWLPTTTGLAVRVDHGLAALDEADTIVVPGIGDEAWPVPAAALHRLRAAHARGARVISVCTGAFVLAAAGLLDGRRATMRDCWRALSLRSRWTRRCSMSITGPSPRQRVWRRGSTCACTWSPGIWGPIARRPWPGTWSFRRTGEEVRRSSSRH